MTGTLMDTRGRIYYPIDPDAKRDATDYIAFDTEEHVSHDALPEDAIILMIDQYTPPDGPALTGKDAIMANIADIKRVFGHGV